mmetsp:Transcript_70463/g.206138  ORF Transcript_70463/g.206138 Transcript_70463/m.206138 type:complete len:448 (+) Transcript_70463:93-1436(+)
MERPDRPERSHTIAVANWNSETSVRQQVDWKRALTKAKQELSKHKSRRLDDDSPQPLGWKQSPSNLEGFKHLILLEPISALLIAWPVAVAASLLEWSSVWTFWLNFLAMIPLAKLMGDATEELAAGLKSDTVGGLLNATFGNAVEMILMVQTIRAGQIDVVKGTLLGSVLSNLLLVLGMSFVAGGFTPLDGKVLNKRQAFSTVVALTNVTMLLLATAAMALPTIFFSTVGGLGGEEPDARTLEVSRYCSTYILSAYVAYLLFQLYTHAEAFTSSDEEESEFDLQPQLTIGGAMLLLTVTTTMVAVSSEFLVGSIDGLVEKWQLGKAFIGIVLLPIVGNACEHVGAIRMAMSEKVDITIGIAVGSSTQVALFVVPFAVIVGWAIDEPMDLNFGPMDTTVLVFAVLLTFSIITDGMSTWLEGYMLIIAYLIIATLYWFFPEVSQDQRRL